MTSDPGNVQELLDAWFAGWAAIRNYRTDFSTGHPAALRLDRSGDWEYFIWDPAPADFAALAAVVAESPKRAMTVLGPDLHRYVHQAHLAGLGMISASEQMMIVPMESQDHQDAYLGDPDLVLTTTRLGGRRSASACTARFAVTILDGDIVVASGKVGIYGEYAVFDQIETHADYRRRGFGRLIMQSLTSRALDYPVSTGLLLASTDGQRLYFKMGWRSLCQVTVLAPMDTMRASLPGR